MGDVRSHSDVLLIAAAFSRHDEALDWGRDQLQRLWGPIALESTRFDFGETDFYDASMGRGLKKAFFAFEQLVDPSGLVDIKLRTNELEDECRRLDHWPEERPLNLDPGYLTEAKLVLATTKDRDHRLYLNRGIFAEVTLHYHAGKWQPRPWTYPDYQRADFHAFFTECRNNLRQRRRQTLLNDESEFIGSAELNPSGISIRSMTPDDYDEVVALWKATDHMGKAESRAEVESFLVRNPETSPVAHCNGRLVGAALCGHDGRRGYLAHLAVADKFRGRGVGRALVDFCLARLRSLAIPRATIHIYVGNDGGEMYWRRTGWRERTDLKVYSFDL